MNDNIWIMNSDYFISTMMDVMSPRELYLYRQTTKYAYTNITLDMIHNRIIYLVCNKLRIILRNKYDGFMDLINKRNMIIHGPFITNIIWGEKYDTNINISMTDKTMGTTNDNVFIDYKNIDPLVIYDPDEKFNMFTRWFYYESDDKITLTDYTTKKYKIKLHIFSCGIDNVYCRVFQNSFRIVNNKFVIKINNIHLVMNKIQPITLRKIDNYYINGYIYQKLNKSCIKYNIQCKFTPLTNRISSSEYKIMIICKVDTNNIHFTMFNKYFCSNNKERIVCNPIKVINNTDINLLYIDVKLEQFVTNCQYDWCPFKNLREHVPIEHFHSCIFLKNDDNKMVTESIIIKYVNNELFSNHTPLLESSIISNENIINNKALDKCSKQRFPPRIIPNDCFGSDIVDYRKRFNNNFNEGEFASDGPYCNFKMPAWLIGK